MMAEIKKRTVTTKISETAIRRLAKRQDVFQIRDPRFSLRFRFRSDRNTGSWFSYSCHSGLERWDKIGTWPRISAKTVIDMMPGVCKRLADDKNQTHLVDQFNTVSDLMGWYKERSKTDTDISDGRKKTIAWAIDKHINPRIGNIPISEINHSTLDANFFRPARVHIEKSTLRGVWSVIKQSFKRALILKMITSNPISSFKFPDFIEGKIKPKSTQIRVGDIPSLLGSMGVMSASSMLVLMMLLHGTRIGETRKLKWSHFNLNQKLLIIPGCNTKNKREHELPLTDYTINILAAYRVWQRKRRYKGVYLFPNKSGLSHIDDNSAGRLIKDESHGKWSSHSLRKAARSSWAELGIDYMISKMMLNHTLSNLDQAYVHTYVVMKKREGLEMYHEWINEVSNFFLSAYVTETIPRQESKTKTPKPPKTKG